MNTQEKTLDTLKDLGRLGIMDCNIKYDFALRLDNSLILHEKLPLELNRLKPEHKASWGVYGVTYNYNLDNDKS